MADPMGLLTDLAELPWRACVPVLTADGLLGIAKNPRPTDTRLEPGWWHYERGMAALEHARSSGLM